MMAHWIGRDEKSGMLTMKVVLIAFHHLPSRHTGEEIAKTMLYLIDRVEVMMANVSVQLSWWTLIHIQVDGPLYT